ncbi:MAG: putative bifunctional diguanylate cyclase/phosphodiesterase [Janthinobacterium lividum]
MLASVAVVALLAGLGVVSSGRRLEGRRVAQNAVHVAELRGTIARLDGEMIMMARMAALSGDRRWVATFDEDAPKLDAAIREASNIASPEIRQALAETTGEAHRDLLMMERRALALSTEGDLAAARSLLDAPEFAYLQEVYADGLDVFGQDLGTLADARSAQLDARTWMEMGGLALLAVLLAAGGLGLQGHLRLRVALAHTAAIAGTDLLTGLPNRRRFCEDLETALADGKQSGLDHALLLIDLDRFKAVNDAQGHPAGDEMLRLVGERLRDVLRDDRHVARLGGDEFAFLLRCDPAGPDRPQVDPAAVAGRIIDALTEPFTLPGGAIAQVGASVGIGLTRVDDQGIGNLMHRADVGLYRAKAEGRGCFRFFEQGADARVRAMAQLESELRQAVADEAVMPHFQPLIDLGTGRLVGVEMLARWPHPARGMIAPAEFIPLAEDSGLIGPMTVSLLRQGCRAAGGWPAHVTLACNLSPMQLRDPNLPTTIANVLAETGFPAARLELEVTESALVGDLVLARRLLEEIRALGVRLALDDFGTGYSSLRHLQLLPFDKLKIDQSFVGAMVADRESAKIVSAVVGLGHSLGLSTVAEGVETEEVAGLLRELGCDIGQGWLFGRPVPAHRIDALVAVPEEATDTTRTLVA